MRSSAQPASAMAGMSDGCAPFEAIAQNPAPRSARSQRSASKSSYAGNAVISVNGWGPRTRRFVVREPAFR